MGYTTEFDGKIEIFPPLNQDEIDYLIKFNESRRMKRHNGPYFVFMGQAHDKYVIDYNNPPEGQPSLWCQWRPTDDGKYIVWDEGEKFYNSAEWMQYLIKHFIGSNPIAKSELPFLQGHSLRGNIYAQGEEYSDKWTLVVIDDFSIDVRVNSKTLSKEERDISKFLVKNVPIDIELIRTNLEKIEDKNLAQIIYHSVDDEIIKTYLVMKFSDLTIDNTNFNDI